MEKKRIADEKLAQNVCNSACCILSTNISSVIHLTDKLILVCLFLYSKCIQLH